MIGPSELLRRSQTRINLLFTMSEIPHAHPVKDTTCEVMFRGRCSGAACRSSIPSGGARRDRTDDLMLAKHALSQLSYGPVPEDECFGTPSRSSRNRPVVALWAMPGTLRFVISRGCATRSQRRSVVGLGRLELPTSRLSSARSNQLSYKPLTTRSSLARIGPWRVFVREERETKTAKSRQCSSTILTIVGH
jgi:hypothetical protein